MEIPPPDYDSPTNPHHPERQQKRMQDYLSDDGWGRKLVLEFDVVGLVNRHRAEFQKMMQRCREQVFAENRRWIEDYYAGDWPETASGKKHYALWERYSVQRRALEERLSRDDPNAEFVSIECIQPKFCKEFLRNYRDEFGVNMDEELGNAYFVRDVLLRRHERREYGSTFWTFPTDASIEAKFVAVVMLHNHTANPGDQFQERKIADIMSEPTAIRRWLTLLSLEGKSAVANTGEATLRVFLEDVTRYLERMTINEPVQLDDGPIAPVGASITPMADEASRLNHDGHNSGQGEVEAATPPQQPSAESGSIKNRTQKVSVNARMVAQLQENPDAWQWTVAKWAEELECSVGSIHKQPTWKRIMQQRETERIARGMRGEQVKLRHVHSPRLRE